MLTQAIRSDMIDMLEYFIPDVGGYQSFTDSTLIEVFDNVMVGGAVIDSDFSSRDQEWQRERLWKKYRVIEEYIIERTLLGG